MDRKRHKPGSRAAVVLALGGALILAGCGDREFEVPGGSFSISPTQPVNNPAESSAGQACIVRDEQGRPNLAARSACAGVEGGVVRGR